MLKTSMKRSHASIYQDYEFDETDDENKSLRNDCSDQNEDDNEPEKTQEEYYHEQLRKWKESLTLLEQGKHPEYTRKLRRIDTRCTENQAKYLIIYEFRKEEIELQCQKEIEATDLDLESGKETIMKNLEEELTKKKVLLENEKTNVDLTVSGDVLEIKPTNTRLLRGRRAIENDNANIAGGCGMFLGLGPGETSRAMGSGGGNGSLLGAGDRSNKKRNKQPTVLVTEINPLLDEDVIIADAKIIHSHVGTPPTRRLVTGGSGGSTVAGAAGETASEDKHRVDVWIDAGRLFYGHKCFSVGMQVSVDSRESSSFKCSGSITSITQQEITIRRVSDLGVCRVSLQQLRTAKSTLHKKP